MNITDQEKNLNWKKNLIAIGLSQFIYRLGTRSLIPFLPLFIHDLGKTNFENTALWSGWIFAAPFIVSFFSTPLWGSFGDRFGRKLMMLLAIFGFSASQLLMGFSSSLIMLLFFASLQEAMGGCYPAAVSLTAANTPHEKSAYALGILQFANGAGNVVGPIIGGVLADSFGYRDVFLLVSGSVALSGLLVFFFVEEKNLVKEKSSYHSLFENWKYLFNKKVLLVCGVFLLIHSLSISMLRPTFSLYVQSLHLKNQTSTITGIILGIYGATASVSSAMFGNLSKRFSLKSILSISVLTASLSSIAIAVFTSLGFLIGGIVISGFALGLMLPLIFTIMTYNTENIRKAGVFGVGSSFQTFGNLAGSIVSGIIVASLGVSFPFVAAGLLFLFVIPISKFGLKNYKV